MLSLLRADGEYVALEAAWPMLLCTRTKVILNLRSSPLVSVWLVADDDSASMFFLPSQRARFTFSGAFVEVIIDSDVVHLLVVTLYTFNCMQFCTLIRTATEDMAHLLSSK